VAERSLKAGVSAPRADWRALGDWRAVLAGTVVLGAAVLLGPVAAGVIGFAVYRVFREPLPATFTDEEVFAELFEAVLHRIGKRLVSAASAASLRSTPSRSAASRAPDTGSSGGGGRGGAGAGERSDDGRANRRRAPDGSAHGERARCRPGRRARDPQLQHRGSRRRRAADSPGGFRVAHADPGRDGALGRDGLRPAARHAQRAGSARHVR
jgi:hypothetical protein